MNDFQTDRIPPHAPETECTVLGSMLLDDTQAAQAHTLLSSDCFYATQNRVIWECLCKMLDAELPLDILSVADELRKDEKLEAVGAEPYLSELVTNVATTANLEHHCKILIEKALLRRVIETSANLSSLAFSQAPVPSISQSIIKFSEDVEIVLDRAKMGQEQRARIVTVKELEADVYEHYNNPTDISCVELQLENLKKLYRPALGLLNVFTGHPSHGKSELLKMIMLDMMMNHDWHWILFSPESHPYKYLLQGLCELFAKKGFFDPCDKLSLPALAAALEFLNEHLCLIEVGYDRITTNEYLQIIRKYTEKHECQGVALDPFNSLNVVGNNNENRTYAIGDFLDRFRILGNRRNFGSWICAHPKAMLVDFKTRKHHVPTLNDIDGSRNWWNMAYNGLSIYRYVKLDVVAVHIQKIKIKSHGQLGVCFLKYNTITGEFTPYYENPEEVEKQMTEQSSMF
jgi:DnaB-like helicase N terminal domain